MKKKIVLAVTAFVISAVFIVCLLLVNSVILFNHPSKEVYPVRGVDVSAYQGKILWDVLSRQKIQFAYIKATEGSTSQDKRFSYNWKNASKTSLRIGAYHFFSYDSSGEAQAENFIHTVPKIENMLPPVVDIEFYGKKEMNSPKRKQVQKILDELLCAIEKHYGTKPIIYATQKSYDLYIKNSYKQYNIWIRNVFWKPELSDHRLWTFWQYSDRTRMSGYDGAEKYIDMNVFNGTTDEFDNYYR